MDGEVFGSNEMFANLPGVNNDREDEFSDMPADTSDDDDLVEYFPYSLCPCIHLKQPVIAALIVESVKQ